VPAVTQGRGGGLTSLAKRAVSLAVIRVSGRFDPGWYRRQFAVRSAASRLPGHTLPLAHYVWRGRRAGASPHPLFEPAFFAPDSWRDDPADPFARLLLRGRTRRRAPHPLFDPETWVRRHPDAARHRFGPFGHFTATATAATALPLAEPLDRPPGGTVLTWGDARAGLDAALARWRDGERLRLAVRPVTGFDARLGARTVARWAPAALEAHGAHPDRSAPVVSVVMPVRDRERLVGEAIASVRAQTLQAWELIVVDDGSTDGTAGVVRAAAAGDPRIRLVSRSGAGVCAARNAGAETATGRYVAWLDSDNAWEPAYLATMTGVLDAGARAAYAVSDLGGGRYRAVDLGTPERARELLAVSNVVDLNVLAVTRELLAEVGGFDESLRRTVDYDLVLRLAERVPLTYVPFVGVRYRDDREAPDRISVREPFTWREVVKNKHLVGWDEAAEGRAPGLVSVLVGATRGWAGAYASATAVLTAAGADGNTDGDAGGDVEVVVVDDAQPRGDGLVLAALALADPRVRVVRTPKGGNRALATNLAFGHSRGATVVAVAEGVQLWPGWRAPLLGALGEGAAAAQPLVVAADGTVASAGATWPPDAALPAALFAGLSADDARRAGARLEVPAAADAAVAVPAAAFAAVRGLDPLFAGAHEFTDLSLRLATGGAGGAGGPDGVVVDATAATALAPEPPPATAADDALFAARWPSRPSRRDLWAAAGFAVSWTPAGEALVGRLPRSRDRAVPAERAEAGLPALRWAIKIGAPWSPVARRWGDLHFARSLAAALERLGQQVVIDHRPALQRDHRGLDDVVLTLRGLFAVTPPPDTVNLLWVISHPDLVTPGEAAAYDRVFAASALWASRFSAGTGLAVEPLLQATDPARFHPDPSVADTGEPVLFVGNSRGVFRPVVRDLLAAGVEVGINGAGWERFVDARHVRARLLANEDLPAHYRAAGVVLNDHWDDMREAGFWSNRLFDAAASGARVVSDHIDGTESLFHGLVHTYRTPEELVALVRGAAELFPPAAERAERARRLGREHSFDERARTLLAAATEIIGTR
jgi:glycosyltransferase involved in cell wall biosynthesis